MDKALEIALDQKHFDRAWEARERARSNLGHAHEAAGGNNRVAADIKKNARKVLDQIGDADESVAHGRIDPLDGEPMYIGRRAINDEERNLLVIGWQAPAAAVFYQANIKDPRGLSKVRKFSTEMNQIKTFEDTVFEQLRGKVDDLTQRFNQPVDDVLLRDLEATRDGEMRDIVQTIHHSQYDLISRPLESLLVVQGGPGTGKSAVALHRVSWLIFDRREHLSPSDFLVVGPSKTFTAYIQKVLPALGNEGVDHGDLASLGPVSGGARAEDDELARLKGDLRMSRLLGRGLINRIRVPSGDLQVGRGAESVVFLTSELEQQVQSVKRRARTYRQGRDALREWIGTTANDRLNDRQGRLARARLTIPPTIIDSSVERIWPSLTAAAFLQDLLGSQQRLVDAAGDTFNAAEVKSLYRPAADRLASELWSASDVALLDEAESQLGGRTTRYAHVVIDEAQDLSPMQIRSIRRRSSNGSYTIVGDVAQSTGPWSRDSWDDIVSGLTGDFPSSVEELEFGYRVPREHFEVAARLLPTAAPGVRAPSIIRDAPAPPEIVQTDLSDVVDAAVEAAKQHAANGLSVGIICPTQSRSAVIEELTARQVRHTDARQGSLGRSINVMTAEESKGLEFDATVVVEPHDIVDGSQTGERRLYIALTRTTGYMTIIYSKPVPVLGLEGIEVVEPEAPPRHDEPSFDQVSSPDTDFHAPVAGGSRAHSTTEPALGRVVMLMADAMAAEIRSSVQPDLWPAILQAMAARLDDQDGGR